MKTKATSGSSNAVRPPHPVARSLDKFPETCEIASVRVWMVRFVTSPMTLVVPQHQLSKSYIFAVKSTPYLVQLCHTRDESRVLMKSCI
jgi:hypothetical protein